MSATLLSLVQFIVGLVFCACGLAAVDRLSRRPNFRMGIAFVLLIPPGLLMLAMAFGMMPRMF